MARFSTRSIVTIGMLTALEIVLSRFLSINAWNIKIGFSFVPIVVAAMMFGPIQAGIVGALGDFLGAVLFPIGPYFPGFTATAFITGVIFGIFLKKEQNLKRSIFAVLINQFVFSLLLNTFWISVLYGSPYGPLLLTRVVQSAILTVIQILVIQVLVKAIPKTWRMNGFGNAGAARAAQPKN